MKKLIPFALFFLVLINYANAQVYIAPDGSDDSTGTFEHPYKTFPKAISETTAGDTIYVRGGVYNINSTIIISIVLSGTAEQFRTLTAYKEEVPILDFSGLPAGDRGIKLQSNYWHIKGLHITNAADNGMNIDFGSYNIIEQCQFYRNKDTGLQLGNGSAYNQIINCDSYYNADPASNYGNADGFAPKLTVGTGNYFYGCRAWGNTDDGWDGYLRGADDVTTTLENCWTWGNGYLEDGTDPGSQANGNGFKMGGADNSNNAQLMHHMNLLNCVAFDNKNKGFDQNNNAGSMILLNCSGYNNITANYRIQKALKDGQVLIIRNGVSYDGAVQLGEFAVQQTNSWLSPFQVTEDDFISLDAEQASAERKADGSLPDIDFLHLAQDSDLIDGGVDIGNPFKGDAPDLGAFESDFVTSIEEFFSSITFKLKQNYPNPFNPTTKISYQLAKNSDVILKVFDITGKIVKTLVNEPQSVGEYSIEFNASGLSSGTYIYQLKTNDFIQTKKMMLVK